MNTAVTAETVADGKFGEVMALIRDYAGALYPDDLMRRYLLLEKQLEEGAHEEISKTLKEIDGIKMAFNKRKPDVDWEAYFASLYKKLEYDEEISIKDIVMFEHSPPSMLLQTLKAADLLTLRRNRTSNGTLRLCKSIYGFTTCTNPCAYGRYGSCLFAAGKKGETSIAEQMFGNITTVDEYIREIHKACRTSNNVKLITTSHKVDDQVLEVILNTLLTARRDKDLSDLPFCVSLGAVDTGQILKLKEAGATRINHNLETSYFNALYLSALSKSRDEAQNSGPGPGTGEYTRRLQTLITALENGMSICSGGMFFYGDNETVEDRTLLYLTLRELDRINGVNSSPFNVYVPLTEIVHKSQGWFNAFELPCIERKAGVPYFKIFKAITAFAMAVPPSHKIVISAGSKWLGDEFYYKAVEVGGGAGLASYLQQIDSEKTLEFVDEIYQRNEKIHHAASV